MSKKVEYDIVPNGINILVKENTKKEQSSVNGFLLPDMGSTGSKLGTVIAVGDGDYNPNGNFIKPTQKVGDVIAFSPADAFRIKIDGIEYHVIKYFNILATIKEKINE